MTQQTSQGTLTGGPGANYERHFVPAIGEPLAHDLLELADLRPGERVLDVACGTGVVARLAAERVGGDAVAGVDPNPAMLGVARQVAAGTAIEWHEARAEELPLDAVSFDVVLCGLGLQFFADRPRALREMQRVLKPGGRTALNVPGPTPPLFAVLEGALRRHIGPEAGGFVATVFSLHDADQVGALLEDAGFAEVRAHSERKELRLPRGEEFLWQYVYSTPLAEAANGLDEDARNELQDEVVREWEPFAEDGGLHLEVDVTGATGRKT